MLIRDGFTEFTQTTWTSPFRFGRVDHNAVIFLDPSRSRGGAEFVAVAIFPDQ